MHTGYSSALTTMHTGYSSVHGWLDRIGVLDRTLPIPIRVRSDRGIWVGLNNLHILKGCPKPITSCGSSTTTTTTIIRVL
ncbi:hypothetical protein Taro_039705 [Colocasia esculenta]|uniref:Uncharacterized protein n=1 Tax=Colocasia esculenta TaxID=4460 RepID=A0A843W735_COLES|nr:hypothetical protein [Colocasia esculenta]